MRACLQGADLQREVARVLSRHLDPRTQRAWIIGSEATGRAAPGADIDIALEGPEPMGLVALARLRADLEELPTLRAFDLVDLRRTSERFRCEALSSKIELPLSAEDDASVES